LWKLAIPISDLSSSYAEEIKLIILLAGRPRDMSNRTRSELDPRIPADHGSGLGYVELILEDEGASSASGHVVVSAVADSLSLCLPPLPPVPPTSPPRRGPCCGSYRRSYRPPPRDPPAAPSKCAAARMTRAATVTVKDFENYREKQVRCVIRARADFTRSRHLSVRVSARRPCT
jgi:hypothetical protein